MWVFSHAALDSCVMNCHVVPGDCYLILMNVGGCGASALTPAPSTDIPSPEQAFSLQSIPCLSPVRPLLGSCQAQHLPAQLCHTLSTRVLPPRAQTYCLVLPHAHTYCPVLLPTLLPQVWDLPHSAALSGWLLILITAGAMVCSTFFERRLWCRYLCPIGAHYE